VASTLALASPASVVVCAAQSSVTRVWGAKTRFAAGETVDLQV
jgi:hypothetical protein